VPKTFSLMPSDGTAERRVPMPVLQALVTPSLLAGIILPCVLAYKHLKGVV
jgi:hypothetical protein